MQLKIKKVFKDKFTNALYKVGDVVEFEQARAEELLADNRNLVEAVEEEKAEKKPAGKAKKSKK